MIGEILLGLAKANLAAGAAVLAVLAVRGLVRPRFGAQASYLLWLAPLAAGLAVLMPHPVARSLFAPVAARASLAVSEFVATAPAAVTRAGPDLASLALALWIVGAVATAALLLRRQAAFIGAMGRLERLAGGVFRAERADVGPAVVGVFKPRIVTPADFETRFAAPERALILAHEGAHLRRGDAAANAVACAVQCLCWFNPLVHVAARLLRVDQELACDASVIDRFPDERRAYAELLLKTQLGSQPLPLGCHWPASAPHPLKARIAMLSAPLPERSMRGLGFVVAAGLTLGAATMAWSAQPGAAPAAAAERAEAPKPPASAPSVPPTARGDATTPVSYAPGGYTPRPGFAEPRINGRPQTAPFKSIWIKKPTGDDLVALYPPGAAARGLGADVLMSCKVGADGRLNACDIKRVNITGANPPDPAADPDFGAATLQLAKLFQMKPVNLQGARTAGTVINIPVMFRLPHPPQPVAPS